MVPPLSAFNTGVAKLSRALRLKIQFKNKVRSENKIFVPNPEFQPDVPPHDHVCESFIRLVHRDISKAHFDHNFHHKFYGINYRPSHLSSLMELASRTDLVITKTDKNLGAGIFDFKEYHEKCLKMLQDPKTYLKIPLDQARHIAASFMRQVDETLSDFGHDRDKIAEFVHQSFCSITELKIPEWYLLPKIHKEPWSGRPICPQHSYVSKSTSKYLAIELNDVLPLLDTVLLDSNALVEQLESSTFPQDAQLYSADVESLYPSIDTTIGTRVVGDVLLHVAKWKPKKVAFIVQLLTLVLTTNVFTYDNCYYHQLCGTAMGTQCAPPYAQIFMFGIEVALVRSFDGLLYYRRYIDDVFFILRKSLDDFKAALQKLCSGIRFTFGGNGFNCVMLDLFIFKGSRFQDSGKLDFKIYQKVFNLYQYITFFSEHPVDLKIGFIRGELLRYALRSSEYDFYQELRETFWTRLRVRGYPASFLRPIFTNVHYSDREDLLQRKSRKRKTEEVFLLNLPFSRFAKRLKPREIIRKHWTRVASSNFAGLFPRRPCVVFSKGRNVFDIVRRCQKQMRKTPAGDDCSVLSRSPQGRVG